MSLFFRAGSPDIRADGVRVEPYEIIIFIMGIRVKHFL